MDETARPHGTPWNEINRLTQENARLRAALHRVGDLVALGRYDEALKAYLAALEEK